MTGKKTILVLILIASVAALYIWRNGEKPKSEVAAPLESAAEPLIRYPIDEAGLADEPLAVAAKPLPSLDESDRLMQDILAQLFGQLTPQGLLSSGAVFSCPERNFAPFFFFNCLQ